MRNAVLPPLLSSEIYNFGNSENQMANSNISMDNKISAYDSSFYLESKAINDDDHNQQRNGVLPNPHQSGNYQFISSNYDNNSAQQSFLSQDLDFVATSMRKRSRPIDAGSNKRKKPEQCQHQAKEWTNGHKMPVKKSQKLSDKITALQKLVSPYGKTDTASVLQEASFYIKLLQQQIQNLFQMLSSSCSSKETGGKLLDLQNRGLCLFPTSVLQNLSQEYFFATCNAYSLDPVIAVNF